MNTESNAFSRAATALGRVENLVKSGDEILTSVEKTDISISESTKKLESILLELQAIRGEMSSTVTAIRQANDTVRDTQEQTLRSVEEQVDRALSHLRDLERSIRAVHEQATATIQKDLQSLKHEMQDNQRGITEAIGQSESKLMNLVKVLIVLVIVVGGITYFF